MLRGHCPAAGREPAGGASRSGCYNCSPVGSAAGGVRRGSRGLDGTANSGLREDGWDGLGALCRRDPDGDALEFSGFVVGSRAPLSLRVTLTDDTPSDDTSTREGRTDIPSQTSVNVPEGVAKVWSNVDLLQL